MSYSNIDLLAPAILYNNPGITREDFVGLIEDFRKNFDECRAGILPGHEGLAKILQAPFSKNWRDYSSWISGARDFKGTPMIPPRLRVRSFQEEGPEWILDIHEKNKYKKATWRSFENSSNLEEGDVFTYDVYTGRDLIEVRKAVVRKVSGKSLVSQTWVPLVSSGRIIEGEEIIPSSRNFYRYELLASTFEEEFREAFYDFEESLWADWPQFHPDFRFDWPEEGYFRCDEESICKKSETFRWVRKGDKYYFDPENFERIRDSIFSQDPKGRALDRWGYHDLMLASEAAKKGFGKLFGMYGFNHLEEFFEKHPDSFGIHQRAIWDCQTSLYARSRQMTNSEFLRARLLGFMGEGE